MPRQPCSSSRTCTGPTRRRSMCSASSRAASTTCPAVLVLTYRDELDRDHPLSRLLGDLGHGDRVDRIAPQRLSAAVGALTAGQGLDADRVYALTDGNPYFVSELVASADEARVPPTVVDAVTGRLRRLDAATQDHVEQLAVVPSAVDPDLLARLVPGSAGRLRAAEEGGLLDVQPDGVRFRHELTRRAVVDACPRRAASSSSAGCSPSCSSPASPTRRGSCTMRSRRATSTRSSNGPSRGARRRGIRRASAGGGALPGGARPRRPLSSRPNARTCWRSSRSSRTRSGPRSRRW